MTTKSEDPLDLAPEMVPFKTPQEMTWSEPLDPKSWNVLRPIPLLQFMRDSRERELARQRRNGR